MTQARPPRRVLRRDWQYYYGLWYTAVLRLVTVTVGNLFIRDRTDVHFHTLASDLAIRSVAHHRSELTLCFSARLASASLWASSILPIAAAICASSTGLRPGRMA
jgi:hypothetical protein